MILFALRHAQSHGNLQYDLHHTQWDHDINLTPTGETQAHAAGELLRDWQEAHPKLNFKFHVSPFERTRKTYKIIAGHLSRPHGYYEEIRIREVEKNYEAYPHEVNPALEENHGKRRFYYGSLTGESTATVYDRTCNFLLDLRLSTPPDEVPVAITHGSVMRCILHYCQKSQLEDFFSVDHSTPNAQVYELTLPRWAGPSGEVFRPSTTSHV